jgi:hypothetical protein
MMKPMDAGSDQLRALRDRPRAARFLVAAGMSLLLANTPSDRGAASAVMPATALANGGFERTRYDDRLDGWKTEGIATPTKPGAFGRRALMLIGTAASPDARVAQRVAIPQPEPEVLEVSCLVKAMGIESVDDDHDGVAKITVTFLDGAGRRLHQPKRLGTWSGSFDWRPWSKLARIPAGASQVELSIELDGAVGRAAFDDVQVRWGFPDDEDRENLLIDGGFEHHSPLWTWKTLMSRPVSYPGLDSRAALRISRDQPGWSGASQEIRFDEPADIRQVRLSLSYKLEGVTPSWTGGGAQARLRFWDGQRQALDPPVTLGPWIGTTKTWKRRAAAIAVPSGARSATLELMLHGATGTVLFDLVRLTAVSKAGPIRRRVASSNDTTMWKPISLAESRLSPAFDASEWLDPPAGRHGFLTVRDGHFAFEDGTPVRFFGVNIPGAYALPTHEEAERLAERLAQMGCNLVRLHHLDAPWAKPNIFDPRFDDTQHLSADSLDRLDYFIAQLKARGIYVYLDLLVSRRFKKGDGVQGYRRLNGRSLKVAAQYSPRLIQLQKQYARDLLTHVNPYTQRRLVDEPAIALADLINESTLLTLARFRDALPPIYLNELRMLWHEYLAGTGAAGQANPEGYLDGGDERTQRFYASLQSRYFEELAGYLRGLGLRIPLAGSNVSNERIQAQDLLTNARLDFIDRHAYWDHPKGGFGDLVRFNNASVLEHPEYNPVIRLSRQRVAGKPFVLSEWSIPWPNEYRSAGPLLMAAYAAFQGWDGLLHFDYQDNLGAERITKNFDVSALPELALQFPVAARLFHRRDVAPARDGAVAGPATSSGAPGMNGPWVSDTGELAWDHEQGLVLIETPRTQAALGRLNGVPAALRDVTFAVTTPFAALALTSLDGHPLASSRHLLLTAVARAENAGTIYNAARTLLRDSGTAPILLEPVVGSAFLLLGERVLPEVFALDAGGDRVRPVSVRADQGMAEVPLGEAPAYEIRFEKP